MELFKRLFSCLFPCLKGDGNDKDAPLRSVSSTEGFSVSHDSVQSPLSTPGVVNDGTAVAFTMAELNKATSNFSTSCKIGQGGFGVVYKGKLADGRIVAIKRARKDLFEARLTSQFLSEVNTLAKVEHLNLVKLIGYLEEGDERILVEEFVPNGNLRQHLDCDFGTVLDLYTRLDIAIDISHALTYLHLYAGANTRAIEYHANRLGNPPREKHRLGFPNGVVIQHTGHDTTAGYSPARKHSSTGFGKQSTADNPAPCQVVSHSRGDRRGGRG
ncbi:hypothetical protein L7F22_026047 [Adiantum nelumboides]|nr:hypothetical protein [Adiantum nelumboides]